MKHMHLIVLLALIIPFLAGCDLADAFGGTQSQIETKAQAALLPYFPKAQVKFDMPRENLIAMTCAGNIGDQLLHEMAPKIMTLPSVQQLNSIRRSPLMSGLTAAAGVRLPRYFSLGFDRSLLLLDTISGRYMVETRVPETYTAQYRTLCEGSPVTLNAQRTQSAWVGSFTVTFQDSSGHQQTTVGQDTLGIYGSDAEFEANREAEITARQELIRKQFAKTGAKVTTVTVGRVEKVTIPIS